MAYKIISKSIDNSNNITAMHLSNENGEIVKVDIEKFKQMVRKGEIESCKAIKFEDEEVIAYNNPRLSEIPVGGRQVEIIYKLSSDDKIVGYKVIDKNGRELKLSIEKTWSMARNNLVTNAQAFYKCVDGKIRKVIIVDKIEKDND